jgi:hypothetical protein
MVEKTSDGLTQKQIAEAYEVLEVLRENHRQSGRGGMAETVNEAHYLLQLYEESAEFSQQRDMLQVGDFTIDDTEPTPSPEVNTVKVVEVTDIRADEYTVEETGKTVAEHNPSYPDTDRVVGGTYPNMSGGNMVWYFPESRLRKR